MKYNYNQCPKFIWNNFNIIQVITNLIMTQSCVISFVPKMFISALCMCKNTNVSSNEKDTFHGKQCFENTCILIRNTFFHFVRVTIHQRLSAPLCMFPSCYLTTGTIHVSPVLHSRLTSWQNNLWHKTVKPNKGGILSVHQPKSPG
jgi:hypothetical protein